MKLTTFIVASATPTLAKEWISCEKSQWAYRGECKQMVGFAAENINLPEDVIDFSKGFYVDLHTRERVDKLNNRIRHDLKNAIALQSMRKEKGQYSCLKDTTPQQFDILKQIANDDFDYNSYGGLYNQPRIDYGEMYLENVFHLLFDAGCRSRKKLQTRLDKLMGQLKKHCQKQCQALGYDYFYHYPDEEPNDYFQAYYDTHSEHEDSLGHEIFPIRGS